MSTSTYLAGALAVVLFAVIIIGTVRRNRWGINFASVSCPNCGTPVPRFGRPSSGKRAAWGGWVCSNCGTEMDKWGRATGAGGD